MDMVLPPSVVLIIARRPQVFYGHRLRRGSVFLYHKRGRFLTLERLDLLVCVALGVDMVDFRPSRLLSLHKISLLPLGRLRVSNPDRTFWCCIDT